MQTSGLSGICNKHHTITRGDIAAQRQSESQPARIGRFPNLVLAEAEPAASALAVAEELEAEASIRHRLGVIAGLLYLVGALCAVASSLFAETAPAPVSLAVLAVVVSLGIVWLAFPWEHAHWGWFDAAIVIAILATAAGTELVARSFALYFIIIALYAGYACRNSTELGIHLALITTAVIAPIAFQPDSESARTAARLAVMVVPGAILSAGFVAHLQDQVERRQRLFREFAIEALTLAARIEGRLPHAVREGSAVSAPAAMGAALERVDQRSRVHPDRSRVVRRPVLTAASLLGAVALSVVVLALAGVSLPDPVIAPLEAVGINLPNQDEDSPAPTTADQPAPADAGSGTNTSQSVADGSVEAAGGGAAAAAAAPQREPDNSSGKPNQDSSPGGGAGDSAVAEPAAATSGAQATAPGAPTSGPPPSAGEDSGGPGGIGGGGSTGPVRPPQGIGGGGSSSGGSGGSGPNSTSGGGPLTAAPPPAQAPPPPVAGAGPGGSDPAGSGITSLGSGPKG